MHMRLNEEYLIDLFDFEAPNKVRRVDFYSYFSKPWVGVIIDRDKDFCMLFNIANESFLNCENNFA